MDTLLLTSVSEDEDKKWVLRKKHDLLKAKYRYLKRIFQIYDTTETERSRRKADAQVGTDISIEEYINLYKNNNKPEANLENERNNHNRIKLNEYINKIDVKIGTNTNSVDEDNNSIKYKKKRIKTNQNRINNGNNNCDVKVGTDPNITDDNDGKSSENNKIHIKPVKKEADVKNNQKIISKVADTVSIDIERKSLIKDLDNMSKDTFIAESDTPTQVLDLNPKRNPSKLQLLIKKIFRMKTNENWHEYRKFRRRNLTLKRRAPRKVQSDSILNKKPQSLMQYVQSVQKFCLRDTTARQCPIFDCRMIFYGIINYNDHLNICHFSEKKFRCHYCHEGFEQQVDKIDHENEHLGISKVKLIDNDIDSDVNDTTKLNKLIAFFDKIIDTSSKKDKSITKVVKGSDNTIENKRRKAKKSIKEINFVNKNGELKIRSKEDSANFDSNSNVTQGTDNKHLYKWIPGTKIIHV